jgi:predicted nucleic acid-binding protein
MIDFVIDANVLISILMSGRANYKPILAFNNFILPDFALIEIEKYKDILKHKSKMSQNQLTAWTYLVFAELTVLPSYVLEQEIIDKTVKLLDKIDLKDSTYVALAMQLDLPLLTRDYPFYMKD